MLIRCRKDLVDKIRRFPQLEPAARGGHESGMPESTPAGFCVFISDSDPVSKIFEKPDPESPFV